MYFKITSDGSVVVVFIIVVVSVVVCYFWTIFQVELYSLEELCLHGDLSDEYAVFPVSPTNGNFKAI